MSLIFQSIVHSTAIHVEVIQLSITLRRSSNADPNPYKSTNPKLFSKTLRCKITITPIVSICSSPGGDQPDPNHSPTMLNTCPSVITWSKSIKFILWTVFNDRFQISCSNLSTTVWHCTITSLGTYFRFLSFEFRHLHLHFHFPLHQFSWTCTNATNREIQSRDRYHLHVLWKGAQTTTFTRNPKVIAANHNYLLMVMTVDQSNLKYSPSVM